MQNNDFSFDKSDREIEKEVEIFASQTIEEAERRSKILSSTMGQITNVMSIRKCYWN